MLPNIEFEQLMRDQGKPEQGIALIAKARQQAPVREVKSTGKNVITIISSRKMRSPIATESRKVEYVAALEHELNPDVLEYFAQPGTYKLELIDQLSGEIHCVDHTPDFMVITKRSVKLQEWKTEEKLASLARKQPWRYQKIDGQWRAPQIEDHFAEFGIEYEVHSAASIHPNRTKNWEVLFDYFDVEAPAPTPRTLERLKAALQSHGSLSLMDLQTAPFNFQADDLLKAIVDGHLACDLNSALLSDTYNFRVYRDLTLMHFDMALAAGRMSDQSNRFSVSLVPGAQFQFDGKLLELAVSGEHELIFNNPSDKSSLTLTKSWLLEAIKQGTLKQVGGTQSELNPDSLQPLLVHTHKTLDQARLRAQYLDMPYDARTTPFSERTYFRLKAAQACASADGGHEILALAQNHYKKGNRNSRLNQDQIQAMEHLRKGEYRTTIAKPTKTVYRELQAYCKQIEVKCPSYPTFLNHIKAHEDHGTRLVRYGSRMAYQEAEFYYTLDYNTPIHGVRPFELVHIDHTLVDIELLCRCTGKPLGRPWLTMMIDAYSRRVMAFHLGFNQPSRAEVLMCFRAFVKKWSRIPFMTICDNGKDLIAKDVENFVQSLGGHFRRRPKGQPRVGSVMERMFGTANTQLFHNLEGNTKLTKNVRMLSGTHLPQRLANWGLEDLYKVIEYWAFEYYDTLHHPTLDQSPREAYAKGMAATGQRPHKMISFGEDFLIATCPSVDRGGLRRVDRQRGIKVHNFYYQSPLFDSMRLNSRTVPVRFDPNDIGRVFFQLPNKEWAQARSMQLASLPRLNVRQLQAISEEYRTVHKLNAKATEVSGERLVEFIATLKASNQFAKELQLMGETERVQEVAGLLPASEVQQERKPFGFGGLQGVAQAHVSGLTHPLGKRATQSTTSMFRKGENTKTAKSARRLLNTQSQQTTQPAQDGSSFTFGDLD